MHRRPNANERLGQGTTPFGANGSRCDGWRAGPDRLGVFLVDHAHRAVGDDDRRSPALGSGSRTSPGARARGRTAHCTLPSDVYGDLERGYAS